MHNKRAFCVTGTGTDVGKTAVTASLLRALLQRGVRAQASKILQTGCTDGKALGSDAFEYIQAAGSLAPTPAHCFHTYPLPASPHLALADVGKHISCADLSQEIRSYCENSQAKILLFETAGGLHVPINEHEDMLTLLQMLGFPVLLVAENTLGTINHTILSVNALRTAGLSLAALVCTNRTAPTTATDKRIREDNIRVLHAKLAESPVLELPYIPTSPGKTLDYAALEAHIRPLAEHILRTRNEAISLDSLDTLIDRDRAVLWHPYTSVKRQEPLFSVTTTSTNHLQLANGRTLIDGMSSWWAAVHGYKHPHILQALHAQAELLPHVMFGGLTHEGAVRLGERLCGLLPKKLARVFFSDSGSVAVEVALKMALQYQYGRGERGRTRVVTAKGGYFGDTFGAMSVCDPENGMHFLFRDRVAPQFFLPRPSARFDAPFDPASTAPAEAFFHEHGREVCALILEPIVQGAGGMWFYHPMYLNTVAKLCKEYDCLLIFDEIATGFGHTGKLFALEWTECCPDILCVGKALTGGTMTLAATLCSDEVAEGICSQGHVFMHGPTFMANPLACACANASLDLFADGSWRTRVQEIETILRRGLAPCRDLPTVRDVRVLGDIGVVETKEPVDTTSLTTFFVDNGVWLRPFNNLVYCMPPYISPKNDLETLCQVLCQGLAREAAKHEK